jgi:regulator of protease activity HflC (stomatin/prohibitin superfamily)
VQLIAERNKRAVILEAEGKKQATILRAQGTKQAIILEAEAFKTATFRYCEARERFAQAEARAIEVISNAVDRGEIQSLNFLMAVKYARAIQNLANSENTKDMLMALETAGAIKAFSGLKEIVKFATLKPDK